MTDPLARHGVYQWDNKEGISTVIESNATKVPGMDGDGWHFAGFGSIALAQNDNGAVICMMADAANDLDPVTPLLHSSKAATSMPPCRPERTCSAPLTYVRYACLEQAVVGIWCRKQLAGQPAGQLELVVSSRSVIPDSPEPTSPQNLFQYVDYPAVTLGTDPVSSSCTEQLREHCSSHCCALIQLCTNVTLRRRVCLTTWWFFKATMGLDAGACIVPLATSSEQSQTGSDRSRDQSRSIFS
eukprot:SAG31_NODE_2420_length_5727_cov_2.670576_2_plen_242_part_00